MNEAQRNEGPVERPVRPLHPYMAWAGDDPADGAALAFAHTAREARRIAYPLIADWCDVGYINVRAKRLREHEAYLMSFCRSAEAYATDEPPTCNVCERWGSPLHADGNGCDACGGEAA